MRVLVAADAFHPKIDGVADTAAAICKGLAARGHQVFAIAPAPGPTDLHGARVVRIKSVPAPLYPELRLARQPRRIARAVARIAPDAAVVLTPGPVGVQVVRSLPPSVRLVSIYTTDMPRYFRDYRLGFLSGTVDRLLRWMSDRSVATLCPTTFVERELRSRGYPRLGVWGRGVDSQLFNPAQRSCEMREWLTGGESRKPLVLYVGRLAREKRLDCLLAAARRLPGCRFALVGDGPQRPALERSFSEVPAVFTGYLRGTPLAQAYASADVFAFPSETETFGQVVIQAMASGLPPVVVRGTAPAELVPNGHAGLHVPPRSPGALAGAVRNLVSDPASLRTTRANAVECSRRFSWDSLLDRLEALLAGVERP